MAKRYEIRRSEIDSPFVGRIVARALGASYVADGGFQDNGSDVILVGRGSVDNNVDAILGLTNSQGTFTGDERYVREIEIAKYVLADEKKRVA